jgi:NADPH:quinone reductase-like Zn-dependent oxidoreductase
MVTTRGVVAQMLTSDMGHASQSLENAVIWRPGTLGVLGRGCPLARGRMRVKELAGKTVFVTGAASGIGLGIATAFAQAGAKGHALRH